MIRLAVLAMGLVVSYFEEPAAASGPDQKTYEAVRAKAGRDASAHVKLALWCEAHGLGAERVRHLAQAIAIDPKQVTARGLLGLVAFGGRWLRPEDVIARRESDPALMRKLEEYHARRIAILGLERGGTDPRKAARSHEKLAMWCEQAGLKDQANAHLTMAIQLDPDHEAPWKHLGYVKRRGRWLTRDEIAAADKDADAQRKADKYWEPRLRKWKNWLGDKARRAEAEQALANVGDARAIPAVMRVFGAGPATLQAVALSILARIDDPVAARELARLAVTTDSESIRQAAIEALKGRVLRDYVATLIAMFRSKVAYEVLPVRGPGSTGSLAIDTPRYRLVRTYDAPPAFELAPTFRGVVGYDANGMPFVAAGRELDRMNRLAPSLQTGAVAAIEARTQGLLASANQQAAHAQGQLDADVSEIEAFNRESASVNQRILNVLKPLAGAPQIEDDQNAMNVWWYDQLGYQYDPPPKITLVQDVVPYYPPPRIYTCFAAATPVQTVEGVRPIEQIQVGDLILGQDVTTGALEYHAVSVVHHNKPSKTLRIKLTNNETLVSSVYHRFWRSGCGWALARELAPGDTLRTLGGQVRVASIEPGDVVPVYNLDVAGNRSFFVGHGSVLVHDNTLPEARIEPFDEPPLIKPARDRSE